MKNREEIMERMRYYFNAFITLGLKGKDSETQIAMMYLGTVQGLYWVLEGENIPRDIDQLKLYIESGGS